jgi:hypothetical protein
VGGWFYTASYSFMHVQVIEKGDNVRQARHVEEEQIVGRVTAVMGQRTVRLTQSRYQASGRWLARLSMLHAHMHLRALKGSWVFRPLALGSTLLLRLAAALARPPR